MTLSNDPPTLIRENTKRKYSKQFKEMIDLCLNKDPAKRYKRSPNIHSLSPVSFFSFYSHSILLILRPTAEKLLQHSFFKQAKKKDYLVKNLLSSLPPLDQRPHRKIPQKHHSISKTTQWDFDGDENEEEDTTTAAEETHKIMPSINTSSVTFAAEPHQPSSQPSTPAGGKKHISFGDAIVKSPSPASSLASIPPTQPTTTTVTTQTPELVVPTAIAPRKSRFVIEDSSSDYGASVPYGPQIAHSPSSASPDQKESVVQNGLYSAGSSASSSHQMLVGLGMTSASSSGGSPNQFSSTSTVPSETEVRKGRFSVNQTHRAGTPTNDNTDAWTDKSISRSGSQDNLGKCWLAIANP